MSAHDKDRIILALIQQRGGSAVVSMGDFLATDGQRIGFEVADNGLSYTLTAEPLADDTATGAPAVITESPPCQMVADAGGVVTDDPSGSPDGSEPHQTALRAGPLAGQDLSLLTERSVLLNVPGGWLGSFGGMSDPDLYLAGGFVVVCDPEAGGCDDYSTKYLAYIGERQDDGFIAAPEGGWEENPVGNRRVEYVGTEGQTNACPARVLHWPYIIAFRLAGDPVSIPVEDQGALPAQDEPSVPSRVSSAEAAYHQKAFRFDLGKAVLGRHERLWARTDLTPEEDAERRLLSLIVESVGEVGDYDGPPAPGASNHD